jgi:hypothetical protein
MQRLTAETAPKAKAIANISGRAEDVFWLLRGRELPAEQSQPVRGDKIVAATASEHAVTAVLWLVLAGLISAAWVVLFEACWLTVPGRWAVNFCPRPLQQRELFAEELRGRELAALLASVKSNLVNRMACPTPQP